MQAVQLPALTTSGGGRRDWGSHKVAEGTMPGRQSACLVWCESKHRRPPTCQARLSCPSWTSKCAARARYAAAWSGRPSRVSTSAEDRHAPALCSSCRCVGSTTRATSSRKGSRVMASSLGPPGLRGARSQVGSGSVAPISRVQEVSSGDLSHVWTVAECRMRHPRPCAAGGWPCLRRRGRDRCQRRVRIDSAMEPKRRHCQYSGGSDYRWFDNGARQGDLLAPFVGGLRWGGAVGRLPRFRCTIEVGI
jgi:hypothetical protein